MSKRGDGPNRNLLRLPVKVTPPLLFVVSVLVLPALLASVTPPLKVIGLLPAKVTLLLLRTTLLPSVSPTLDWSVPPMRARVPALRAPGVPSTKVPPSSVVVPV